MPLGPVVAGPGLPEHEVVGAEDLTEGAGPHAVHGAGLEVHQHGAGHVLAAARLVVVDVDPLELEVRVAMVGAGGVDAVLVRDDLPELQNIALKSSFAMFALRLGSGTRPLGSLTSSKEDSGTYRFYK